METALAVSPEEVNPIRRRYALAKLGEGSHATPSPFSQCLTGGSENTLGSENNNREEHGENSAGE
jgi:hypothetical protein